MNEAFIKEIQKLNFSYKNEKNSSKKLIILHQMGSLLCHERIVSQKDFWQIQNEGYYVNRSILLRSFWFASAFKTDEVQKVKIPISRLFSILSYLAPNSKKIPHEEKIALKRAIMGEGKYILPQKNKKLRVNTAKAAVNSSQLSSLISRVNMDEAKRVRENLSESELNLLKAAFFELLKLEIPSTDSKEILKKTIGKLQGKGCENLVAILELTFQTMQATKMDSKVIVKKSFEPSTVMPLLDLLFFKKL